MRGRGTTLAFSALLIAQLVLLSWRARVEESERRRLERWALGAVAPVAQVVDGVLGWISAVPEGLRTRRQQEEKITALEQQIEALLMERSRLRQLDEQIERLSSALGYKPAFTGQIRLADVIYVDHASWLQTLLVYLPGHEAPPNSPVTSPQGLVGRVILSEGPYAKVQLVTDRASGVGAMIERTRRQGVARGAGRDGMTLEYVPLQADVRVGDRVVSSGTDGLYPRGVPLGTVISVTPGTELFHEIALAPAVDFGVLDQVFVVLGDTLPGRIKSTTSASP